MGWRHYQAHFRISINSPDERLRIYVNNYRNGVENEEPIPAKSIIIHRYYDVASQHLGSGKRPSIIDAATALGKLIEKVQKLVCGNDQDALERFKVYLIAHSMGRLICRCLLQNHNVSTPQVKALVDLAIPL